MYAVVVRVGHSSRPATPLVMTPGQMWPVSFTPLSIFRKSHDKKPLVSTTWCQVKYCQSGKPFVDSASLGYLKLVLQQLKRHVVCGSGVELRTLDYENPGSNPVLLVLKPWASFFTLHCSSSLS